MGMLCDVCGEEIDSYYEHWRFKKCAPKRSSITPRKMNRADPERIISEYGAEKLSKTREGVRVIEQAAAKYKKELLQPNHPDFKREYGKEIRERAEAQRELRKESDRQWAEKGGREKLHEN